MLHIISAPSNTCQNEAEWEQAIYLDTLEPTCHQVGFGSLGTAGQLGYEGKRATVCEREVLRGLSAHAPSRVVFELGGKYSEFRALVGISDDVIPSRTKCKFALRLDGRNVQESPPMNAGFPPHVMSVDVRGALWMELIVTSDRFEHAHAVWIDPQLLLVPHNAANREDAEDIDGPHTLVLHGNLGDHAAHTGVPYAYWKAFGRRLYLCADRPDYRCLWERNQYSDLVETPIGKSYSVRFENYCDFEDWKFYRPQRIFTELTGMDIAPENVSPALYHDTSPVEKRVVVCDQASWQNRRGYPYMNSLLEGLRDRGWEVIYMRNTEMSERQIYCEHVTMKLNLPRTIKFISTASLFIGYDSGLAHIAAGLDVPSVQFAGSTPPIVFKHRNCIFCLEACTHCCTDNCPGNCLTTAENRNEEILSLIAEHPALHPNG